MIEKYAFEYEKVILQGGQNFTPPWEISVKDYVGIRRVKLLNSSGAPEEIFRIFSKLLVTLFLLGSGMTLTTGEGHIGP